MMMFVMIVLTLVHSQHWGELVFVYVYHHEPTH